ncbi:MAG: zf-HC2 domain-containing protein [Steroidobacteraceae bacterium]
MIPGETSENHAAAAWIAGTMNAAQRQEFEAHLATCPQCQEQCGAMITRTMRQLQEPPAAVPAQAEVTPEKSGGTITRNLLIALCAALVLIAGFALGWWAWQLAHR